MARWAGLQALIFDLDGTLYESPALLAAYPRLAAEYTARLLRLSLTEAVQRFAQTRQEIKRATGTAPSSTLVLIALTGASLDEWGAFVAERIDPADYLDPKDYDWLRDLLPALHRHYRLGIVSNNNRILTERILRLLGVLDDFDAILTITESQRIKPDPTLYQEMAAMLGVPPDACLSIGDRQAVDIVPAEQAGMRGVLVHGSAELRALGEELLAAASGSPSLASRPMAK